MARRVMIDRDNGGVYGVAENKDICCYNRTATCRENCAAFYFPESDPTTCYCAMGHFSIGKIIEIEEIERDDNED